MRNWIAILAILLVALAPVALAEESTGDSVNQTSTEKAPDKVKGRMETAKDRMATAKDKMAERKEMGAEKRALRLETREDIKALRDQVKAACEADKASESCKNARMDARDAKHTLLGRIADKMGPTFKRAEQLEAKLTRIVERLAKNGKDTSGLDTTAIKAKIGEASALFDEGKAFFDQARAAEPGQKDELMKQAAQKFRDANKALKEARALIVNWLKSVRQKDPKAIEEGTSTTTANNATVSTNTTSNATISDDGNETEHNDQGETEDDNDSDDSAGNTTSSGNTSSTGDAA